MAKVKKRALALSQVLIKLGQHCPSQSSIATRVALPLTELQHRTLKSDCWRKGYFLHPLSLPMVISTIPFSSAQTVALSLSLTPLKALGSQELFL
jgi:hypothetical protein